EEERGREGGGDAGECGGRREKGRCGGEEVDCRNGGSSRWKIAEVEKVAREAS
ncbi:MAG: hypothetical protein INR71_06590, partial [Terriglobus roseus]|nr:hypothetical protein [Terriglobus roseus]